MTKVLFQWDDGNRQHAIYDHPERHNTQDEIESLFNDPAFVAASDPKNSEYEEHFNAVARFVSALDLENSEYEERFNAVARSNQNRILFVVYVIRNGNIRPISCRPASRNERNHYDRTNSEETETSD